ncbi:MAG TPA: ABC transporter permease [Thermoanaerobaculaceae bacterium]|nr:ABC transporter permease [Thermoanaerobaculaceae bacterium]HRS15548.1 ABC transporter permease [Thermoanaerobaculaceae bacterium]
MSVFDLLRFAWGALRGHRLRSGLSVGGVAVGIAAVVTLTALGEGAREYVLREFATLGTNLVIVMPGKVETTGAAPFGGTVRDLTLEDFQALSRLERVRGAAPLVFATDTVRFGGRGRAVPVLGTTSELVAVRKLAVGAGSFLPPRSPFEGGSEIVLGPRVARELFGPESPLGQVVRVGGWRFRVVGVLAPRGRSLGFDFDDVVFIPARTAMRMFNRTSLFRVLVEARSNPEIEHVRHDVLALLAARHRAEDVTVITQDAVLSAFAAIMRALTLALAGIASVSLAVAGVGIMNVMLVTVTERRAEVGLLKALGAGDGQVRAAFLCEAALLSSLGGVAGLALGEAAVWVLVGVFPTFPAAAPGWAIGASLALAVAVGIVFGVWPAHRATRLDPVAALARR